MGYGRLKADSFDITLNVLEKPNLIEETRPPIRLPYSGFLAVNEYDLSKAQGRAGVDGYGPGDAANSAVAKKNLEPIYSKFKDNNKDK